MHENLKYSIRLDKNIKPITDLNARFDSMTNIDSKNQVADWQTICSGFDYETHYLIYAKFIGEKVKVENEQESNHFEINRVQLYIQNYAGGVSIGFNGYSMLETSDFVNSDDDDPENDPRYPNRKRHNITIGLEGFRGKDCLNKDVNIIKERNKDGTEKKLVIKEGDILFVDTIFSPIKSELTNIFSEEGFEDVNFVDEKFMERVGEDIFISTEGENRLTKLHNFGIISDTDFSLTGIDKDDESIVKSMSLFESYLKDDFERKGRVYQCVPRNSIFYIN